jgi:hypothetical protein
MVIMMVVVMMMLLIIITMGHEFKMQTFGGEKLNL